MLNASVRQIRDLEAIVELLYSLFGKRRTKTMQQFLEPEKSRTSHLNNVSNATNTSSESYFSASYQADVSHQEILNWLDELMLSSASPSSLSVSREAQKAKDKGNDLLDKTDSTKSPVHYSQSGLKFYSDSKYFQNLQNFQNPIYSLFSSGLKPGTHLLEGYANHQAKSKSVGSQTTLDSNAIYELSDKLTDKLSDKLSDEIREAFSKYAAAPNTRRQDKLDVVPQGRKLAEGLYSLELKIEGDSVITNYPHYAEKTLMRVKTSEGVETVAVDSSSRIAKAYHALDDKGLVGLFEKTGSGAIELAEVLGLDSAKLAVVDAQGGNISINYHLPGRAAADFEYLNRELVLNPESRNHGYDFMRAVTVTEERAKDHSIREFTVINEQGREEQYEVRNNSAIAIMADAMTADGYTPEIKKMDVLSNDGSRVESGIYIKNAYKNNRFGQKQELITDTKHGGLWVEVSKGSSRSEFVDPSGCSLNLERATPLPGQVIEARLGVVGRYDNRNYE